MIHSSHQAKRGSAKDQVMYCFTLYRAARLVRKVTAETMSEAIAACPEFTSPTLVKDGSLALQWFDTEAFELIAD